MRKFVNALLFVAVMLSAASCITDDRLIGPVTQPGDKDVDILLNLRTPGGFSAPRTRGLSYAEENTLSNIYVFVFENAAPRKLVGIHKAVDVKDKAHSDDEGYMTAPSNGNSGGGGFSVTLPPHNFEVDLMILANAEGILDDRDIIDPSDLETESTWIGQNYTDVAAAIWDEIDGAMYTSGGVIPMWGETVEPFFITPTASTTPVNLTRAVARIDVGVGRTPGHNTSTDAWTWDGKDGETYGTGSTIPFVLKEVYVVQANTKYALIPTNGSSPTIPATSTKYPATDNAEASAMGYSGTANITSGLFTTRSIYIPEADILMGGTLGTAKSGDTNHKNRMAIVVGGEYGGSNTTTYYRLDFANSGVLMNVLRNHLYQFNISKVSGVGHPDVITAYESNAMNMTVEILDWDEEEIGDIIFEGNKYFSRDLDKLEFAPVSGQQKTVTFKTNITDLTLTLGDKTIALPGGEVTTDYYKYKFSGPTGVKNDTYTLTVTTLQANVSDNEGDSREEVWTINASRIEGLELTVDQPWMRTYISVDERDRADFMPEGATGLPIDIASNDPVNISIDWKGGETNWISSIPSVTDDTDGIYLANLTFDVEPYEWFQGCPARRSAEIVLTSGGDTYTYLITQEAPFLQISPAQRIMITPRPAYGEEVRKEIIVKTNLPEGDIPLDFVDKVTGEGTIITHTNYVPASHIYGAGPRWLSFEAIVVLPQNNTEGHSSAFTIDPDNKYGLLPTVSNSVVVGSGVAQWTFGWRGYTPFDESSERTTFPGFAPKYTFPWNTTSVGFNIESNLEIVNSTVPLSGTLTQTNAVLGGDLIKSAYTFDFGAPDVSQTHTYSFKFNDKSEEHISNVIFDLGAQSWSLTQTSVTTDYKASTPAVEITSNIEWAVAVNGWKETTATTENVITPADDNARWLNVHTEDTPGWASPSALNGSTVTQNDHMTVVGTTTVPIDETNLSLQIPVMALNPTVTGGSTPLVSRSATVIFGNNDAGANGDTGIDISNQSINVTQYAPVLKLVDSTLPGSIPSAGGSTGFSVTAEANVPWGIRVYHGTTQIANGTYSVTPASNAGAISGIFTTNLSIPSWAENDPRTLDIYIYCTDNTNFPTTNHSNEIKVGSVVQLAPGNKVYAAPGQVGIKLSDYEKLLSDEWTLEDAKAGNYTLTLKGSSTYADTWVANIMDGTDLEGLELEPVYAVYFKWGSMVAMIGGQNPSTNAGDTWSANDVVWVNPGFTGNITASYGSFTPASYSGTNGDYNIVNNVANGHGDICKMLTGDAWRIPRGNPWQLADGTKPWGSSNTTWTSAQSSGVQAKWVSKTTTPKSIPTGFGDEGAAMTNDQKFYLPAAGYRLTNGSVNSQGTNGYYWSSSASSGSLGYNLSFTSGSVSPSSSSGYAFGFGVRCVRP